MNFTDLYRFSDGLGKDRVSVERLRSEVKNHHPSVGDVHFYACALERAVSLGHMVLELERSSPYEESYILASIRFDKSLPNDRVRFVCAKELMHVFDSSLEKTSNKERFLQLMDELENNPISVDQSKMFKSERNAEWMALITLCPLSVRMRCIGYLQKGNSEQDIAKSLGIPFPYMKAILGPQYLPALERLTGESSATIKLVESGGGG